MLSRARDPRSSRKEGQSSSASASISTFQRSSSKPFTTIIVAAGAAAPKASRCAVPTACANGASVRYMRVLTTWSGDAPRFAEGGFDDLEAPFCLHVRIRVDCSVRPDRRRAGDQDSVPNAHRATESDPLFERRSRPDVLSWHGRAPSGSLERQQLELLEAILDRHSQLVRKRIQALARIVFEGHCFQVAERGLPVV